MNLKDRLENIKQSNIVSIKEDIRQDNYYCSVSEIFVDNSDVRNLLLALVRKNKNIIFSSDKSVDNLMVAFYLQNLLGDTNSEIINHVDENIENINFRINIVPEPDINEIVKIFEYIIYGYKSFIFGFNLNNSINAIDKMKAVIALNFKNLTDTNINTLIGSSDSAIVFVSKNEDGLFYISEIDEINYVNGELLSEKIFLDTAENEAVIDEKPVPASCSLQVAENIEIELEDDYGKKEILSDCAAAINNNIESIEVLQEEAESVEFAAAPVSEETALQDGTGVQEKIVQEDKDAETQRSEQAEINMPEQIETIIDTEEAVVLNGNTGNDIPEKKVNKYKLLKEKIKNKKSNI